MTYQLRFEHLHHYSLEQPGITLPVRVRLGSRSVEITTKLDTGATYCIFGREYGEDLGLRIEAGLEVRVATPAGSFHAFGHSVTLEALGLSFDTMVYFAERADFPRNVLGQRGWLDRVRLALVDYDGHLYLSPY